MYNIKMALHELTVGFSEMFLVTLLTCFVLITRYYLKTKHNPILVHNWPLVGMLPEIVFNSHRIHDRLTEILEPSGATFLYKGPLFTGTDMLITADPTNVHYIMSRNFPNFVKGSKFHKIFDSLGDGILNSDDELWKKHKKISRALIHDARILQVSQEKTRAKLRGVLVPILDRLAVEDKDVDFQDLFQRLTLDLACTLVTGFDPESLSLDLSEAPYIQAGKDIEEATVYRHVLPEWLWRLLRCLDLTPERKHRQGLETIDKILFRYISMIKIKRQLGQQLHHDHDDDLVSTCLKIEQDINGLGLKCDDQFLRDVAMTYIFAGREASGVTLSWFFWLLSKNPSVITKIRQEVEEALATTTCRDDTTSFKLGELNKLVYLHGALCETLRLYPPVPFQHKSPLRPDILPTGHLVDPKLPILFSLYSMGRMRSIWGDDCLEFKPERWIQGDGHVKKIKHEASYKFLAFNSGPRTCPGKEVAMAQLKMVSAMIIHNYDVKVVENHIVVPQLSVILHMKHGLMVRVTKRRLAAA